MGATCGQREGDVEKQAATVRRPLGVPLETAGARGPHRLQYGSIEPFETLALTLKLLGMTLDGRGRLALALCGRLLVLLATTHFREDTGLFTGTLEATQRDVKRLVITYFDRRH
ncbi:hypothetical protein BOX17_11465 [Halomonas aestuarii]|uniref:Uncharacterized protein n=1 Tax=Halomonas aestuarii TaxID=1897729 RepID=A0A1J0VHM5_9GAMM|nr:hypothetical protein BOX17_11465 [Halomonas aestuarii]